MSKSKLISRALVLAASAFVGVASYFVISKVAIYLLIDSADFATLQVLSYTPIPILFMLLSKPQPYLSGSLLG